VSQVPCPFQVPLKGIEDLPTNYFTAGVVTASIKKESVDPNNVKCGLCEENDATVHCVDCPAFLCTGCKKMHLKIPSTAHHQFTSIEEALKGGSGGKSRVIRCQKHPQYEVNSYCKTDQTAVCPQCIVEFHQGHEFTLLSSLPGIQGHHYHFSEQGSFSILFLRLSSLSGITIKPRL